MKLLLDTHVVFWAWTDDPKLSTSARIAIEDTGNQLHVSVASVWEMAIKVGVGKWSEAELLVRDFEAQTAAADFALLAITLDHVRTAGLMQAAHRDPFDRLLAAQAQIEGMTLVTADPKLTILGAKCIF